MFKPQTAPPPTPYYLALSYPARGVLLVTFNRPKEMNSITIKGSHELSAVMEWLDQEPTLHVAVLTGSGRAFCAGANLKEWGNNVSTGGETVGDRRESDKANEPVIFSRRRGKKPVIAAVNGLALGGGMEFVVNCDVVVMAENAQMGLPEVTIGVAPFAGVLPRLIRTIGLQRASEIALTGRFFTAQELFNFGLVNKIVPHGKVVEEAVKYAKIIAANSPDGIITTRSGLREGWARGDVEEATQITFDGPFAELQKGENIKEGLKAFKEKRKPTWGASKL